MPSSNTFDISVIIPFKDHSDLTIACLETLQAHTAPVKEIFLISNNSSTFELDQIQKAAKRYGNTKVLIYDHPFNFHKINNWAATFATGSLLLFMNNDIEIVPHSKNLLSKMAEHAKKIDVGAVGSILLYEDRKTIQHAGVYLIPGGTADHLYIGKNLDTTLSHIKSGKYHYDISHTMPVSAVTAAVVMVKKELFDEIGGFNEDFIICGGDVDLCLRLNRHGKQTYLIGFNEGYMIHKESRTRSALNIPYIDFVESYKSYSKSFSTEVGDPFLNWEKVPHE